MSQDDAVADAEVGVPPVPESDQAGTSERSANTPQRIRALLELRELILSGEFAPGQRLSELPLVERLGVSRTPLRLALTALEHEGLLEPHPVSGFVVRGFTVTDAIDAIELRGVLEGTAARLAAERVGDDRLRRLRQRLADLDEIVYGSEQDVQRIFPIYVHLNERFHDELLELADSPMLRRSFAHATSLPFASPNAFVRTQADLAIARQVLVVAQEQHRSIVEAIGGGEGARAEAVAREHARLARRNLEAAIAAGASLDEVPGASLLRLPSTQPQPSEPREPPDGSQPGDAHAV